MIFVKLREVMDDYRQQTGERITHEILADRTGLSRSTIESLASRTAYNARLSTIDKICRALKCDPGQLLELGPEE
jgi:DNA-binding Xre family transcriptional regulator